MARERTIPSPSTFIQDFGLNVTPPPAARNKKIVVIGTAEDGPMYEPILIDKPEDSEYVWGRQGTGDLVRGIFEAWGVQDGYPTVVGVRIGNGKNSFIEINETSGAGDDASQATPAKALRLEAKFPGQIYNQVTIGYNDNREVSIYNPKTGLSTAFSVDTERPNNVNAQVHNVAELVDAINADRNLSSVITATYTPLQADYEVMVSGTSTGIINSATGVQISLEDVLSNGYVTTNGFMIPDPIGTGVTASNFLINLDTVEAVSVSEWEEIPCKGLVTNKFDLFPLDGKGMGEWDTIQCLKDYNNDNYWIHNPSGNISSEFAYSLSFSLIDDLPTSSGGYGDGSTNSIRIAMPTPYINDTYSLCLDDSEELLGSNVASGYINARTGTSEPYQSFASDWTQATMQGIDTKLVDGVATRPSGLIKVYVSNDSDVNGYWQELPYDNVSGIYLSSCASGYANFSIGASGSYNPKMRALVDINNKILKDKFVRISAYTVKGFLSEVESLPELEDAGSTRLSSYFVRGQEVLFNKAPEFNIIVNYGTRITYEAGANVSLSDAADGFIKFTDPELLPGPGGGALSNTKVSFIRFRYTYMPQFPAITTAAKNLQNGTNGNVLSEAQRYAQFDTAFQKLRNYTADIWLPMNAFIDAVAERYNPITGLKEEISIGYENLLQDFLEDMSINSTQPHAVLGVTPMTVVNQANKDDWATKLTVIDLNDPIRGANIQSQIQNKFITVVAFEPVFLNIGRGRPYTANGQAAYAGLIASMPYDLSPTNKEIPGVQALRFDLSIPQYEAMNSMRYVTMREKPGRNPVIVEDVTAAPYGSDFTNWSIFSITAEASNRVRSVAETFIGRPNSVEVRNAMEQLISNALMNMNGLRGFNFSINSTPSQQVLGLIEIDLILVPVFTIKKIRTTVKLRKNLPTAG
jgi:hypothetical protein